jgi:hypothetical protein
MMNPYEYDSPVMGFEIVVLDNGKNTHSALVREGCDGSPDCAMEWYVSKGHRWLAMDMNIHFSDRELERMYKSIKAVRKARRRNLRSVDGEG